MSAVLKRESGPWVWLGARFDPARVIRPFSADEIEEIATALAHLRGLGDLDFPAITPDTFPLPTLGPRFMRLPDALRRSTGVLVLRGLSVDRFGQDDLARILQGIGAHTGRALPQSHHGELIGHVMDVSDVEPGARGYHTGRALGFHTDNCDVVALLCLRTAPGGRSRLVSAGAVHNGMLARRPELLSRLYAGIVHRRSPRDAEKGSGIETRKIAIFSRATGELSTYVNQGYVRRAIGRDPDAVTPQDKAAMDAFHNLLEAPSVPVEIDFAPGDIQFLNNRRILHGRSAYAPAAAMADRRHLMRLWLAAPTWPPLPSDQGMHDAADHAGWLRHRTPGMELPSLYLAEVERRRGEIAAEAATGPPGA